MDNSEKELIESTISKDNQHAFFVIAFGRKYGLALETDELKESDIELLCSKIKDRLVYDLNEMKK